MAHDAGKRDTALGFGEAGAGSIAGRLARFYVRVGTRRPRRNLIRSAGCVVASTGGTVLWIVADASSGVVFGLVAVAAAFALIRWRCETLRCGGLRWFHRGCGAIEVELVGGGYSWRRDLKEVAAASFRAGDDRWRSYEVEMVTAVFPVRWLRAWGFEISDCGPLLERVYSAVYGVNWIGWWLAACMRSAPRPRYRKRSCVRARHRMGPWMDVVAALPDGLRESRRDREFSLTR